MRFQNFNEIIQRDKNYDVLRWNPDVPFENWPLEDLHKLRKDLSDVISALVVWLDEQRMTKEDYKYVLAIKKKFLDFQWFLVLEEQRREKRRKQFEKLMKIVEPRQRSDTESINDYGLDVPLKGSDFYKKISDDYAPISKEGGAR